MSARCVMVLGTTSGAGKSWLATALCRWYSNQGLKVAPFKAQNMSNNARVVEGGDPAVGPPLGGVGPLGGQRPAQRWSVGGEIGSAQYFQALAARAVPEVRMNPLLLKPEADTRSQVVLMGQVDAELSKRAWRGRSASVWPVVARAFDELRAENDVIVLEGAGSPAEINLRADDIVNMRMAQHADARCLLVTDIDRGGAFAHLYGTWALLSADERRLIRGFVLNKFRGDASLLSPAPEQLQALTGVPTLATIPMQWQHGLPEEDGVHDERAGAGEGRTVAVVAYPRVSNLDEFEPLRHQDGVRLVWARTPAELDGAHTVVLPGSKHTSADLAWLRARGLDAAIAAHAGRGGAVLGICGGLQMLGEALVDEHGIDGNAPGLGLLPLVTRFEPAKTLRRTAARFGTASGAWAPLSGLAVEGYEIHHGQTAEHPAMAARGDRAVEVMPGLAWQNAAGNVLGLYLHGLFEQDGVRRALWGADEKKAPRTLEAVFEGLADTVERHFAPGALRALLD